MPSGLTHFLGWCESDSVIFVQILMTDGWRTCYEIAPRQNRLNLTDDKSTLVQVIAWCLQAINHHPSQWWPRCKLHRYGTDRPQCHYCDVIMSVVASRITSFTIVCSTVYSGADQIKHQSSASGTFVWGIYRWPVNSPHKRPVMRIFPIWWRYDGV